MRAVESNPKNLAFQLKKLLAYTSVIFLEPPLSVKSYFFHYNLSIADADI